MHYHRQFWISVLILISAIFCLRYLSYGEAIPLRRNLSELPLAVGDWKGREQGLEERAVEILGVEDSVMRAYINDKGLVVWLYVGYYESQRQGDIIHSPKHCYPASGWHPAQNRVAEISLSSGDRIKVNQYVIQKGLDKQVVLYWYQERGRIITNEYWAKLYLVFDAITRNRTDGALVRISAPVIGSVDQAHECAVGFVRHIFPHLEALLPGRHLS